MPPAAREVTCRHFVGARLASPSCYASQRATGGPGKPGPYGCRACNVVGARLASPSCDSSQRATGGPEKSGPYGVLSGSWNGVTGGPGMPGPYGYVACNVVGARLASPSCGSSQRATGGPEKSRPCGRAGVASLLHIRRIRHSVDTRRPKCGESCQSVSAQGLHFPHAFFHSLWIVRKLPFFR